MSDEWTPTEDERDALALWATREPPRDLAERVAARTGNPTHASAGRRWMVAAAAALAAGLLAVGTWVALGGGGASSEPIPVAVGNADSPRGSVGVSVTGASLPADVDVVMANLIASGLAKDEARGWAIFKAQLHSEQQFDGSLRSWRRYNYATLRRKVKLYVGDAKSPRIVIEDTERNASDRDTLTVKVRNAGNPDMPTPCHLRKDPKASNAWRVVRCSL